MDEVMVSICCLAYNHEKYIQKALDGILKQKTNFSFEILLHDDASTDNTAEIIREYEEKYPDIIKPIYQTENQYSKRVAITHIYQYPRARGKYIAFCECDDFWTDENKLQKQVDFLEQNPEYVACVHKYIVVDEENVEQDIKTFGYYEEGGVYTFNDFFEKELPSQLATLVMRNIVMDNEKGYPQALSDINLAGDIKLNLWLLIHGNIYRMNDIMSAYRFVQKKGGNSYSSRMLFKTVNYKNWNELCKLEKLLLDEYGLEVYFKERRLSYALGIIKDLNKRPSFKNFLNVIKIIFKQRGTIRKVLSETFHFMSRRYGKTCE